MACNPDVLKAVSLFALLDEEELAVLASQVELRNFAPRQRIYKMGEPSAHAFIMVSGSVEITTIDEDNQVVLLDMPIHGEVFGFASMLAQTPHQTDATAIETTECIEVDLNDITVLLRKKPDAGLDLMSVLGKQFHATERLIRLRAARNPNTMIEEAETLSERVADLVATFGGSWTFIITFGLILAVYSAINVELGSKAWDPYPFILLNLFLSMLAAIQAPIIMMSQNRQDKKDRLRSELDFDVNRRAHVEIQGLAHRINLLHDKIDDVDELIRTPSSSLPPQRTELAVKRYLPWVVAAALFMEQLDSTIVNTAVPAMAESLQVTPLSLKAVVTSYILSLAVCIPVSGWMADRFGTRRVFGSAVALFTFSSILCGLALNAPMLVAARILQGIGAAMMMPVGRLAIIRTFPKSELLMAMNFVIIPALIGPLLGPTVGGLIVHWLTWRDIFFVNIPVGIVALLLAHRYMPDYRGDKPRPLDIVGLVLFGSGTALLSWLLEIFGEHHLDVTSAAVLLLLSISLLAAYVWHARQMTYPLLRLALFRVRTFRVSVMGGFITRLGVGGLPFLLPLLYQLGLGMPAWQSGLLMMPAAAAAMGMKFISARVLARFGYRQVLIVNTVMIGVVVCLFSLVSPATPILLIVLLGLSLGFFNSLQYTSMNSMAYADIDTPDSSMASTIASTLQQMSMSFGLACGSLVVGWYLGDLPQTDRVAVTTALHHAFLTMGSLTILSSLTFWTLHSRDGESVSRGEIA